MADYKLSQEQEDIINFAVYGLDNMIVQAVAGAGKTSTLIECAKSIDSNHRILIVGHNTSTKDTLKKKIGDLPNVKVYTIHGLAWRLYTEHFEETPVINPNKYRDYINKNINEIGGDFYQSLPLPQRMMYKSTIMDLVDKARYNLKQSEKEIKKMATKKYGCHLLNDECKIVSSILKWGQENRADVDYQDLLCFPYEFGYFTKKYLTDIIMLDEAQDASMAQLDVIQRCFTRKTRMFSFGDKDQMINGWCGSDTEAFEHLKDSSVFRRNAKELPLTTNYRCGKKIIEYAKQYTDNNIHAREGAQEGEIRHDVSLNEIENGDMVLCRNIAPLMEVYRYEVNLGKKVYFRGEELGKNIQYEVDCAYGDTMTEIINSIKKRMIATWDFLTKETNLDPRETVSTPIIAHLYDVIKTLECLPKTVEKRSDLSKFIEDVFSNEGKEGIELSTIHRAKGLESDNVFIICPSLIPSRLATLQWEIDEERHLEYVMCTRPKNTLNFVTEREIRPSNAYSENNSFYNELMAIKEEVYAIKEI